MDRRSEIRRIVEEVISERATNAENRSRMSVSDTDGQPSTSDHQSGSRPSLSQTQLGM
jgi:hypothetical protein